jgi:hypothetical protein
MSEKTLPYRTRPSQARTAAPVLAMLRTIE